MRWEQDLNLDIRLNNHFDYLDTPFGVLELIPKDNSVEFSLCNHQALHMAISECGGDCNHVLEIGVCRNEQKSSTYTILKYLEKSSNPVYLGIDLNDKSFLDDAKKGIYTLKENSSNYDVICEKLKSLRVEQLDFILIDGWHSINQILDDWEFVNLLRPNGVVAFHDVTSHPGPHYFINNLNKIKWKVVKNLCPHDNGFGYAIKLP